MGMAHGAGAQERWAAAAEECDLEGMRAALAAGADPQQPCSGWTALGHAAHWGDREALDWLLSAGASIDGGPGPSPLALAALGGAAGCVRRLLECGADPRCGPKGGCPGPLHAAARAEKVLAESGPGSFMRKAGGAAPDPAGCALALLESGADPQELDEKGVPAAHGAAGRGASGVLGQLIRFGADLKAVEPGAGRGALMLAALSGNAGCVRAALEAARWNFAGADVQGWTALRLAASTGDKECMLALAGACPGWAKAKGLAKAAAQAAKPGALEALLEAGANPDERDEKGGTPLAWAAALGLEANVGLLLRFGADPNLRALSAQGGQSPAYVAILRRPGAEAARILKMLLDAGADPMGVSENGVGLMELAAAHGEAECLGALLAAGANPRACPNSGEDLVACALALDDPGMASMLLEAGARFGILAKAKALEDARSREAFKSLAFLEALEEKAQLGAGVPCGRAAKPKRV